MELILKANRTIKLYREEELVGTIVLSIEDDSVKVEIEHEGNLEVVERIPTL